MLKDDHRVAYNRMHLIVVKLFVIDRLIEDVSFGIDSTVIKRTDRGDKVIAVFFELAGRESNCLRCPIIDMTFDHTE
jgi:hypothetical protein